MNVLKVTLIVVALLSILILTGCQEGYSSDRKACNVHKVAYQPTGTGFGIQGHKRSECKEVVRHVGICR